MLNTGMFSRDASTSTFRIEAGDLGLVIADWELNGTGPDGSPVELRGSTADVARRGPDGWKVVIDNPFATA